MLKEYIEGQPIACKFLINLIQNKSYAHAYLFNANNNIRAEEMALSFAKSIICPHNKISKDSCDECSICERIDKNTFPEIKVLKEEGLAIKKESISGIKKEFNYKSLEGNKRVYIINEAEKLNHHSANSILKFLEEPEENIIAILITNNIYKVPETIVSRCQIINFSKSKTEEYMLKYNHIENKTLLKLGTFFCKSNDELEKFVSDEKNSKKMEGSIKFLVKYEKIGIDIMLEMNELWYSHFKEKGDYIFALNVIIYFYKDVLNYMNKVKVKIFNEYNEEIAKIASQNNSYIISSRLIKIFKISELLNNNVNLNLIMDKLIISLEGEKND